MIYFKNLNKVKNRTESHFSSGFPTPTLVPTEVAAHGFLCIHKSLQFGGQQFALEPHFSYESKKSC